MGKKGKILTGILIVFFCMAAGGFVYYKMTAPPSEEWLAYHNETLISGIDSQLAGLDMDRIIKDKEKYVLEKEITDIQNAVSSGSLTYEELTAVCLYRIKTLDQNEHGLNSVISVNPNAIEEAREKDRERRNIAVSADALYGIPILLKDNINTAGIPTSAGASALAGFIPSEDAEITANLKDQGAVILGKNNLSEFAGYMSSTAPAGYSNAKGQTVNPFGPLKISPSGSSSGSAVSVTANLTPVSIGTETDGSIVAPAAANSVVGFKATRDTVSNKGILPLIRQIDTPGPITKSVQDAAAAYNAISGRALNINWDKNYLQDKTIGFVSYEYNDESQINVLRGMLQKTGANIIDVRISGEGIIIFNNIPLAFKMDFEDFAGTYDLPVQTLDELITLNNENKKTNMKYGQDYLEEAADAKTADTGEIKKSIEKAAATLNTAFTQYQLDGIVFLNSTASTFPAAAGYPELTVPLMQDKNGAPQGATFTAPAGEDEALLQIGYSFQEHVSGRVNPLETRE